MNADLNSHSSSSRGSCSPRLLTKSVDCLSYLLLLSNSHLPLLFESSSPPMFTKMAPFQVIQATNQSKDNYYLPIASSPVLQLHLLAIILLRIGNTIGHPLTCTMLSTSSNKISFLLDLKKINYRQNKSVSYLLKSMSVCINQLQSA